MIVVCQRVIHKNNFVINRRKCAKKKISSEKILKKAQIYIQIVRKRQYEV